MFRTARLKQPNGKVSIDIQLASVKRRHTVTIYLISSLIRLQLLVVSLILVLITKSKTGYRHSYHIITIRLEKKVVCYRIAGLFRGRKFSQISRICPSSRKYYLQILHHPMRAIGGVANIMAIRENFIREIHKCQPFAKIFSREINPLYGIYKSLNFFKIVSPSPFLCMAVDFLSAHFQATSHMASCSPHEPPGGYPTPVRGAAGQVCTPGEERDPHTPPAFDTTQNSSPGQHPGTCIL